LVAGVGDGDNSLSMRWVKLGSTGRINHADGARNSQHELVTQQRDYLLRENQRLLMERHDGHSLVESHASAPVNLESRNME
jgi:hypothetical protein